MSAFLYVALLLSEPGPFTVVNGTAVPLEYVTIRPSDGKGAWRPLGPGRLSAGARSDIAAVGGDLCAFDVQASAAGTKVVWPGINLCDVKTVTLNRRPDGTLWVDYD